MGWNYDRAAVKVISCVAWVAFSNIEDNYIALEGERAKCWLHYSEETSELTLKSR